MTLDAAHRELLQKPVIVRVNTVTPDGYPHSVPVWFLLEGDDMIVFTERKAQKVKNAQANPKGSIAYGGDPVGSPCLLIVGDWSIQDDPDHAITARITHHYEPQDAAQQWLAAWKDSDHVILRLKPRRVIRISYAVLFRLHYRRSTAQRSWAGRPVCRRDSRRCSSGAGLSG